MWLFSYREKNRYPAFFCGEVPTDLKAHRIDWPGSKGAIGVRDAARVARSLREA